MFVKDCTVHFNCFNLHIKGIWRKNTLAIIRRCTILWHCVFWLSVLSVVKNERVKRELVPFLGLVGILSHRTIFPAFEQKLDYKAYCKGVATETCLQIL